MDEEITNLEYKINDLNSSLLLSSIQISTINDETIKIKKEYYKSLLLALKIIQKQKEEIINLRLIIIEKDEEICKKDIMRFCM